MQLQVRGQTLADAIDARNLMLAIGIIFFLLAVGSLVIIILGAAPATPAIGSLVFGAWHP